MRWTNRAGAWGPALAALLAAAACDDGDRLGETPPPSGDAGVTADAGTDGGAADPDGGATAPDGGSSPADAGPTPTDDTVERVDLPPITLGANGESGEVTFDVPADTTSFMVVVEGQAPANFIVKSLTGPGGEVLVSDDDSNVTQIERFLLGPFAAQFKSPNRVIQDVGVAAALFPNNPGITVSPGAYTIVLTGLTIQGQQGVPYQGEVQAHLLVRKGEPTGGVLPVTLYFTGAGGITAASAPTDPLVQDALTRLGEIYGQASVRVGAVRYRDSEARFRTLSLSLDGSPGAMEEMFASTVGEGPGLHFFFVDRFEGGLPGGMVAGVSGGLPGPARAVGTFNSGVAVALSAAGSDPDVLAHVMAHEGGHWLGLFHTSEITGTEDQHPETPAGQAGDTYLMYPAVGGGTTVSPSQGAILRRHMETIAE